MNMNLYQLISVNSVSIILILFVGY